MQELRFVAVSEDGSYAVLAVPGRSGRYILPIDERLRAVALGQASRLAQYDIEVESPLRPKEIQARIRAGETAEEIADAAGIPVERVRWFEGPVLAERAYIADQAQAASVRRAGDAAGPGPRLGEIVSERLSATGTDATDGQWDSRKRGDGHWQVSLTFPSAGRVHTAEWVFDPRRRHVMPDDDNAARLSLPESELPPEPVALPGEATVTPIASRLGAVAGGMGGGGGYGAAPGVSRFRPERSVIPDRSLGADRSLVDRPVASPAPERPVVAERPVAHERPAMPPRSGYQEQPVQFDYAEFPESAPYRAPAPTPAPQPAAHRAPAQEPVAYRPPAAEPAEPPAYYPPVPSPPAFRAPEPAPTPPVPVPISPVPSVSPVPSAEVDVERVRPTPPPPAVFEDPVVEPEPVAAAEPVRTEAAVPAEAVVTPQEPEITATTPVPVAAVPVEVEAVVPVVAAPTVPAPAEPVAEPAEVSSASTEPEPEPEAEAGSAAPTPAEDQSSRQRAGAKKNPKGRRSSVPSWDEIMLGSSRQRD